MVQPDRPGAKLQRRHESGSRMRLLLGRTVRGAVIGAVGAMASPAGGPVLAPRYAPHQLECARFREVSRSNLETYVGGRARRETLGLDGEWRFRAGPARADSVRLEGWFDTLAVSRRSEEGTLEPETDALIGGRYRGVLSPDGRYRADARPFVPDEVAEVADLSRALDDLLPRLPAGALAVGAVWTDGAGLEIRRLGDSTGADSVARFRRHAQAGDAGGGSAGRQHPAQAPPVDSGRGHVRVAHPCRTAPPRTPHHGGNRRSGGASGEAAGAIASGTAGGVGAAGRGVWGKPSAISR